jgi:hypothetical protein
VPKLKKKHKTFSLGPRSARPTHARAHTPTQRTYPTDTSTALSAEKKLFLFLAVCAAVAVTKGSCQLYPLPPSSPRPGKRIDSRSPSVLSPDQVLPAPFLFPFFLPKGLLVKEEGSRWEARILGALPCFLFFSFFWAWGPAFSGRSRREARLLSAPLPHSFCVCACFLLPFLAAVSAGGEEAAVCAPFCAPGLASRRARSGHALRLALCFGASILSLSPDQVLPAPLSFLVFGA